MNDIFLIQPNYIDSYQKKINSGQKYIKSLRIIIVSLCRNAETYIDNNLTIIADLLKNSCLDYRIILFENDSQDKTKQIIQNHILKNDKIILLSENYNRPQFGTTKHRERTEALAEYRNILKDYVKINYSNFDYVIVMDSDFKSFSHNGIFNSFGWLSENNSISAIAGNSFEIKPIFDPTKPVLWNYDSWAFRGTWWEDLDAYPKNMFNNYNSMLWFGFWILPIGSEPITINSAFGGTCIYKNSFYINGNYFGNDCEHVTFHHYLKNNFPEFQLYLNPSQIMLL